MKQPPTILTIESHGDTRELYAESLRVAGYRPIAARTTDEGWRHAVSGRADAIVTGIGVDGSIDGLELVRQLRQQDETARTPILVVTAYVTDAYRRRAWAAGCDAFLAKPCPLDELIRELRRLLPPAPDSRPTD